MGNGLPGPAADGFARGRGPALRQRSGRLLRLVVLLGATTTLSWCAGARAATWSSFGAPQAVAIAGYAGSAEEPFITPDGRYLLFNSSEALPDFSLQFARAIDAQSFESEGEIQGAGVNESDALSGTPTLDDEGNLYFISTRSYNETLSTVYAGQFSDGLVTGVHQVAGVSGAQPGKVDFDVGVSPNGSNLYVAVGQFSQAGGPTSATIAVYDRSGSAFVIDPSSAKLLKAVNKVGSLNYAADLSSDELELFFTAASPAIGIAPAIYRATRARVGKPFAHVERIAAITGFAEAPSVSSDGTTLYYHEQVGAMFQIKTVTRVQGAPMLTKISPKSGPAAGATTVKITGTNLSGTTAVFFGLVQGTEVHVLSDSEVTVSSPSETSGTVDVTLTSPHGGSAVSAKDHFRFKG
jgi:hypothetical protein